MYFFSICQYFIYYFYVRMFCLHVYLPHAYSTQRDQKRVTDPLGLELQRFVMYHVALGIEPRSSERVASVLNH